MSEREQPLTVKAEAAPYEAEINGSLNLNSYAAMSVCGLVAQAAQHLHNQGAKLSPASINRFAHVLAGIVMRVQRTTTGLSNFQSGANTRLRGFLFTALEMWPAPFLVPTSDGAHRVPASLDQWKAWIDRVESFLHAALASAVDVYDSAQEQIAARPESFFAEGGDGAANHIAVTAVR